MFGWLKRRWYDAVFWSSFLFFTTAYRLRIVGRRNMPAGGPVLVLSNHQSFFDPVLVGLASRRRYLVYLARRTLFKNRVFKTLIESLDAIPIDQEGIGKGGLQATLGALAAGRSVLVFPEGHRTYDGRLQELMAGAALLVKKATVPVVPVGIAGAFEAWPRGRSAPRPGRIAVAVGKPVLPEALAGKSREEILAVLAEAMKQVFRQAEVAGGGSQLPSRRSA